MEQGAGVSDVAYHVSWPSATDPWYLANTADPSARVSYYGIWGVSATAVDGDTFIIHEDEATLRAAMQSRLAMPSRIWMNIGGWADASGDSVFMMLQVVADSAIGTGNKLYMAVAENYEHWNSPSPNGQTDFYGALYKMYPSAQGQNFTHSGNTSDTVNYRARFAVRHGGSVPMRLENMKFLAWVQNTATKDLLQSKSRNFSPLTSPHSGDTLYVNVPVTVTWSADAFTGNLILQLDRNYPSGEWETALDSLPNNGSAEWTVTAPPSNTVRFRLVELEDPMVGDTSKGNIFILPSTTLAVNPSPIEGELAPGDTLATSVVVSNTGDVDARVTLVPNTGSNNYIVRHSDEDGGPSVEWVDASRGTAGPTGDDATLAINLPFSFPFYGQNYSRIWMCTNGWFSFANPGTDYRYNNAHFPVSGVTTFLAVFWDDLNITGGATTRVYSDTTNHRVVVAWIQAQRYNDAATRINAEAVLYQDGRLEFQYGTLSGTRSSATVGIQNSNGTLYTEVWYNTTIPSNHALAFDQQRVWARPLETTFTVPMGGTHNLPFVFDARNFTGDTTVTGTWDFSGNLVPLSVPVTLTVTISSAGNAAVPSSFAVSEAYPNPFNPITTINLRLEKTCDVKLMVYAITGQEVATLWNGRMEAGEHRQIINATNWATGLYFLRVRAGEHQVVRKLLLLK